MPALNTELANYFSWLSDLLSQDILRDEKLLSTTVEIPLLSLAGSKTLLQALGYDNSQVYPQSPVKGYASVKQYFADFRVGTAPHYWVLELKSPSEKIDRVDFAVQVQDYMEGLNREHGGIPLGVLFNGREARVFINPKYKPLRSHLAKLHQPVKKANNLDELRLLFQELQCVDSPPDTLRLARKFIQANTREIEKAGRAKATKAKIRQLITATLACPSREVATAIIEAIPELSELNANAEDVQQIWQALVAEKEATPQKRRILQASVQKIVQDQ